MNGRRRRASRPALTHPGSGLIAIRRVLRGGWNGSSMGEGPGPRRRSAIFHKVPVESRRSVSARDGSANVAAMPCHVSVILAASSETRLVSVERGSTTQIWVGHCARPQHGTTGTCAARRRRRSARCPGGDERSLDREPEHHRPQLIAVDPHPEQPRLWPQPRLIVRKRRGSGRPGSGFGVV